VDAGPKTESGCISEVTPTSVACDTTGETSLVPSGPRDGWFDLEFQK
jgi:hypothetical protein